MADGGAKDFTLASDPSRAGAAAGEEIARIDFSTFVLSLATTAMVQLGLVPDPSTGTPLPKDPLLARQTIDTLEMLRDKTRGNLDEEEQKLIDSLLYDLRMRFVEASA